MLRRLLYFILILQLNLVFSQDEVVGVWLSETGNGKMEIYKKGDQCFGKIVWLKTPNGDGGILKVDSTYQ